jgi:lysophospholipase L1-like esterase
MKENKISRKNLVIFLKILILTLSLLAISANFLADTKSNNRNHVACIGDSITQITNYPNELQTMLGANYLVKNFGVSGSTVLNSTVRPYIQQEAFKKAKEFLPDTVIIMLGTNDANTHNLPSINQFVKDYTSLINQIQKLATEPIIFIVKPPPIFYTGFDINNTNLQEAVMPRIEQVAKQLELPTIDVYSSLINYPEYFPDGVHPNNQGGKAIANQIYQTITSETSKN